MAQKAGVIFLVIALSSCATFRHNAIPVQEQLTSLLETISRDADKAVSLGVMTKQQRQDFAKQIMLPSIAAASKVNDCLLNNNCSGVTVQLTVLSSTLLLGVNSFVSILPASDIKTSLIGELNSAITFATGLYKTLGGKLETLVEETNPPLYYTAIYGN